jgi:hypothetical protein
LFFGHAEEVRTEIAHFIRSHTAEPQKASDVRF